MALIEPIARVGLVARGALYIVVGLTAVGVAVGLGGRTTDLHGAVAEVGRFYAGGVLLLVLALGLAAYVVWRVAQAIGDLDEHGSGLKGWAMRLGELVSALIHFGLALTAGGIAVLGEAGSLRTWVARALSEPLGAWAVGIAGAIVMGVGVNQFYRAWTVKFEEDLQLGRMSPRAQRWARRVGRFGLAARGVTFLIVGWFLMRAAFYVSAREVKDMGEALRVLGAQPYGAWLLGVVACGTIAYGVLSLLEARYRRIIKKTGAGTTRPHSG
ncbi:MAG: DUF1206 domain-containing protein [Myxococcales bacterium]|nr:DUF1206 domain-containing protein [Myxococcales bacterium]